MYSFLLQQESVKTSADTNGCRETCCSSNMWRKRREKLLVVLERLCAASSLNPAGSGLMQHATAVIRRLWVYEKALLCREVTGRVEELENRAAEHVKRFSSNILWQSRPAVGSSSGRLTSTQNHVRWFYSLCVLRSVSLPSYPEKSPSWKCSHPQK